MKNELLDYIHNKISKNIDEYTQQWLNPKHTATRYFIVDDLLPAQIIREIYEKFPINSKIWNRRDSFRERKYTFAKLDKLNPLISDITSVFHENEIIQLIGQATQIYNMESDPTLYAGGISLMEKGDFLNPHIDNSHDSNKTRYRRANLLFYITPNWEKNNGGNLELWNADVTKPVEIVSRCNRLVVMETNKTSWHSVNSVINDYKRCCISNYYFSKQSPEDNDYYHVTSFLGRPGQNIRRIYGRLDNTLRQFVATTFGVTRGKKLARKT